jgi:hypothetical protein
MGGRARAVDRRWAWNERGLKEGAFAWWSEWPTLIREVKVGDGGRADYRGLASGLAGMWTRMRIEW